MNSPNDPDPGLVTTVMLWICGWWLVLLFGAIIALAELLDPRDGWKYTRGGRL